MKEERQPQFTKINRLTIYFVFNVVYVLYFL